MAIINIFQTPLNSTNTQSIKLRGNDYILLYQVITFVKTRLHNIKNVILRKHISELKTHTLNYFQRFYSA